MDCAAGVFNLPHHFSLISEFFSRISSLESGINSLAGELPAVESITADVRGKLDAAARLGVKAPDEVTSWLTYAERFISEAASVVAQFSGRVTCLGHIPLDLCSAYRASKKAEELLGVVQELKKKASEFVEQLAGHLAVPDGVKDLLHGVSARKEQVLEKLEELGIKRSDVEADVSATKEEVLKKVEQHLEINTASVKKLDFKSEIKSFF